MGGEGGREGGGGGGRNGRGGREVGEGGREGRDDCYTVEPLLIRPPSESHWCGRIRGVLL